MDTVSVCVNNPEHLVDVLRLVHSVTGGSLAEIKAAIVSGQPVYALDGADAVAYQVLSPYAAEDSSVSLAGAGPAVIGLADTTPVVVHLTR